MVYIPRRSNMVCWYKQIYKISRLLSFQRGMAIQVVAPIDMFKRRSRKYQVPGSDKEDAKRNLMTIREQGDTCPQYRKLDRATLQRGGLFHYKGSIRPWKF